jgi:hypothetical protein
VPRRESSVASTGEKYLAMRQRRSRGNLFARGVHTPGSSLRMRAVLRRAIETTDVPDRRRWR